MRVITKSSELEPYSRDSGIMEILPEVGYVAQTEEEVVQAMDEEQLRGRSLTPRGGGTSIPSQSVGRGAILLQGRAEIVMAGEHTVSCGPAVVKGDLNAWLAPRGLWVPVDPSSYASCTVAGMAANNSSGLRRPKYGSTIDYVTRLRVVIPGGKPELVGALSIEEALAGGPRTRKAAQLILENWKDIESEAPKVTKNSCGYRLERSNHDGVFDLPKLFVGSEGTLGVFTEVTFSVVSRPAWRTLFIVETALDGLDEVVNAFRSHSPAAVELVDKSVFRQVNRWDRITKYARTDDPYMVFCELDGSAGDGTGEVEAVGNSKAGGFDPLVVTSTSEVSAAWEVRSETLTLAQEVRKEGKKLVPGVEDLTVPPERLGDLVRLLTDQFEKRGLEYISYGHAGDANLHARPLLDITSPSGMNVLADLMEDCFEAVWKMGGTMTGEHGDGMLRAKYVERQYPKTFWIMKELKRLYDPRGLLNPGVKLP